MSYFITEIEECNLKEENHSDIKFLLEKREENKKHKDFKKLSFSIIFIDYFSILLYKTKRGSKDKAQSYCPNS